MFQKKHSLEALLCSLSVTHGHSTLPHPTSPYKGETKKTCFLCFLRTGRAGKASSKLKLVCGHRHIGCKLGKFQCD